jgi:hypothetical protein
LGGAGVSAPSPGAVIPLAPPSTGIWAEAGHVVEASVSGVIAPASPPDVLPEAPAPDAVPEPPLPDEAPVSPTPVPPLPLAAPLEPAVGMLPELTVPLGPSEPLEALLPEPPDPEPLPPPLLPVAPLVCVPEETPCVAVLDGLLHAGPRARSAPMAEPSTHCPFAMEEPFVRCRSRSSAPVPTTSDISTGRLPGIFAVEGLRANRRFRCAGNIRV